MIGDETRVYGCDIKIKMQLTQLVGENPSCTKKHSRISQGLR